MRKTLLKKAFFFFLFLALLMGGGFYYLYEQQFTTLPFEYVAYGVGGLIVLFLMYYYFSFVKPLRVILHEIDCVLTGRPFKKIYTQRTDEMGILAYFFNQIIQSLGKITGKLKDEERMSYELNMARQVQKNILPVNTPVVPGLYIVAKTKPAAEVGGDNFDFITAKDKTIAYVGDVTGHGVPAGLIMAVVNTLVYAYSEVCTSIFDIVVQVNKQLKKRISENLFMTMVMLSYDHTQKKMSYVGCGHEHILVYHAAEGRVESRLSGGIALGMLPDNSKIVKELELPMNDGDFVMLYTDGITETRNEKEELFGLERLMKAVEKYAVEYPPEGIIQHIAEDLGHYAGTHVQDDDMTLIIMKPVSETEPVASSNTTHWNS